MIIRVCKSTLQFLNYQNKFKNVPDIQILKYGLNLLVYLDGRERPLSWCGGRTDPPDVCRVG